MSADLFEPFQLGNLVLANQAIPPKKAMLSSGFCVATLTNAYGGSIQNRMPLSNEVPDAVRAVWPVRCFS